MFGISVKADRRQTESQLLKRYSRALLYNRRKIKPIENWCREHLHISFAEVVCARPAKLMSLRNRLDDLRHRNVSIDQDSGDYLTGTLYKTLDQSNLCGNAKTILLESLGVAVCPYCNRNFVYNIENSQTGRLLPTCELDHFLPKNKYPLLAVSFYNLIPSCHFCNHTKGTQELKAFYPHLLSSAETGQIRFSYWPVGTDYHTNKDSVAVVIIVPASIKQPVNRWHGWKRSHIVHDIEVLKLRQLYEKHNDVVQKLLLKHAMIDESYVQAMYESFARWFSSKKAVRDLLLDAPSDLQDAADTPLGKLKFDVLAEHNIL